MILKRPYGLDNRFVVNLIARKLVPVIAEAVLFAVPVLPTGRLPVARPINALISQTEQVASGKSLPPLIAILTRRYTNTLFLFVSY